MFSAGVELAIRVAIEAHDGQLRKSPGRVPYLVHPAHIAVMLARHGADDEVVQAGLLHDVVEDCDDWTLERLREQFAERVVTIVDELTEDKSLSWEERKHHAAAVVPELSEGAALVKACDKLHNLHSLAADLGRADDTQTVWAAFTGGRERTLDMSGRLVEALAQRLGEPVAGALRDALRDVAAAR